MGLTFSKNISRVEIEPGIFEITFAVYDNGSCQCFKDCDCYKNKGKFLYNSVRYSYGQINEFGKERTFNSLQGCKESLKAKQLKIKTIQDNT